MNIKRFVLPTLVVAGFALGSAAANAATIDFDDLTSGADANTDATAAANGISFSGAELVQDVNADGDPLGTFTWTATSDPVFAVNSAAAGWGTAPSASNALDARFNAVMISLSSPGSIFFSATLDNSTLNGGNFTPGENDILFLDSSSSIIYRLFADQLAPGYVASASVNGVSRIVLASGALYDNVTVSSVPLPAGVWLLLSGMGGLAVRSRRRVIPAPQVC